MQRRGRLVHPRSTSLMRSDHQQIAQLRPYQQTRWHRHRNLLRRLHRWTFRRPPPSTCMLPIRRCSHPGSSSIETSSRSKDAHNQVEGLRHLRQLQQRPMHWLVMVVPRRGCLPKHLPVENVYRSSNHILETSLLHKVNQGLLMQLMIPVHIGTSTKATTTHRPLSHLL